MIIRNAHLSHFTSPLGTDLEIKSGESILLLGNSGCGKTSLLKAIAGFSDLQAGEIEAGDKGIAMLLQNPFHQIIMQKVYDELYFPLKNANKSREEADIEIKRISEDLNIQHLLDRDISTLSFGETQLVMIAATCLTEADIYLMDEPTSHLDPPKIMIFYSCMKEMAKSGKSICITSQSPDEYNFNDKVWIMDEGTINAQFLIDECPEVFEEHDIILDSKLVDERLREINQ
ncbi:MAG: ABC transporter ATP-binding protein [Candidatus Marinimicrobia bacterium]|nr:ABC transporter ATP-binding protein [Candidatus Neomarinimicrobiota bacterium]